MSGGELGRAARTWGTRCMPLVYDPFLWLGEVRGMRRLRREVLGHARGRVLELGAGTGLNVTHYPDVERLVLTEPESGMASRLERSTRAIAAPREVMRAPAEKLPFDDASFDTVVATLVFCTVSDPRAALLETRRVLAPGGQLLFIEHVRATPDSRLERWQDRLYRPWRAFAYGCRCNQDTLGLFAASGLPPSAVKTARWHGMPPLVRPIVYGQASPAGNAR